MAFHRPLSDGQAELIAERLRVLGQPLRVTLVDRLARQPSTVQELVDTLETTQQNISQHLGILYRAGIVTREREGTRVRYALIDTEAISIIQQTQDSLARRLDDLAQQIDQTG